MSVLVLSAKIVNLQRQVDVQAQQLEELAGRLSKIEAERLSAHARVGRN